MKVGFAPRAISYPMESLPSMQSLFQVLQDCDRSLVQAVLDREFSTFAKYMEDFKPLMGVLFSEGSGVCPAFAKPVPLCCKEAVLLFNTPIPPFVPEKLLHQEFDCRSTVVDFLSSLAILFR